MKKQCLTRFILVSGGIILVPDQHQVHEKGIFRSIEMKCAFQLFLGPEIKALRAQRGRKEIGIRPAMKRAGFLMQIISPKNVKKLKTYCTTQYLFKPLRLNSFKELSDTGNDQANYT